MSCFFCMWSGQHIGRELFHNIPLSHVLTPGFEPSRVVWETCLRFWARTPVMDQCSYHQAPSWCTSLAHSQCSARPGGTRPPHMNDCTSCSFQTPQPVTVIIARSTKYVYASTTVNKILGTEMRRELLSDFSVSILIIALIFHHRFYLFFCSSHHSYRLVHHLLFSG